MASGVPPVVKGGILPPGSIPKLFEEHEKPMRSSGRARRPGFYSRRDARCHHSALGRAFGIDNSLAGVFHPTLVNESEMLSDGSGGVHRQSSG